MRAGTTHPYKTNKSFVRMNVLIWTVKDGHTIAGRPATTYTSTY